MSRLLSATTRAALLAGLLAAPLLRADDEQPNVKTSPAVVIVKPDLSPAAQLKDLTAKVLAADPAAKVTVPAATNPHLGGERVIVNPFHSAAFATVRAGKGETPAGPVRSYASLAADGALLPAVDPKAKLAEVLKKEDTSKWHNDQWLQAAQLYVHLSSPDNEDGWKVLNTPDEFMAIQFNMSDHESAFLARRRAVASNIVRPQVANQDGKVIVTFYAYHIIGGYLRLWTVNFKPTVDATSKSFGQFGGGGHD